MLFEEKVTFFDIFDWKRGIHCIRDNYNPHFLGEKIKVLKF
jgi:hypothetical protein